MLLIISGHQRSGTSMLWKVCNSHPDIWVTFEFGNIGTLRKPYKRYRSRILRRWRNIGNKWALGWKVARTPGTLLWNFAFVMRYLFSVNKERRRRNRKRVNANIIESALKRLCPEATIVGDKWPSYVFVLDKLTEVNGLSRIIIYRDCRDVVNSNLRQVRTAWRGRAWAEKTNTAEKIAEKWVKAIENMEHHADKLYIIRYEDLVRQPERELAALGEWLGVDPAGFPAHIIRESSIGKYKSGLTEEELAAVIKIAGPTMERLGYEI